MAGTLRTRSALDTLFADNVAGDISAQDLRDFLWSAPILLGRVNSALTTGNLTATVNYHHVLTVSGMTADRDLVIPAGTDEGDIISFSLETDAPASYEMRLIGDTGVTLNLLGTDRTATADNEFLYLQKGEGALLRWDDTDSKWLLSKQFDGRIPTNARIETDNTNAQSTGESAGSYTENGNLQTTAYNNGCTITTGSRTTPSYSKIAPRRSGNYVCGGGIMPGPQTGYAEGQIRNNTDNTSIAVAKWYDSNAANYATPCSPVYLDAGDEVVIRFRTQTGYAGILQYTTNNLQIQEIL